jgi:hypothetical protein
MDRPSPRPRGTQGRLRPALIFAIALGVLTTLSSGARAQTIQWYVEVLTDPITKAPVLEARILTRKGYRFHFQKRDDNSLWAEFRMPRHVEKNISRKRLPTYWIDGRDPVNLESLKELEVGFKPTLYNIDEKSVYFIIWGALKKGIVPPPLRDFMLGDTLHVRYWTETGEMEQADIPLKRANEAIAQMLNVTPLNRAPEVAEQRRSETFETVARHYLDFCDELRFVGSDTDFDICRDRFVTCSEAPDQSEESFRECLNKNE